MRATRTSTRVKPRRAEGWGLWGAGPGDGDAEDAEAVVLDAFGRVFLLVEGAGVGVAGEEGGVGADLGVVLEVFDGAERVFELAEGEDVGDLLALAGGLDHVGAEGDGAVEDGE